MKYVARIEYDGSAYSGWQYQHHSSTVQETLQGAIAKVANHSIEVVCSGRTDTGVHATGQIVHFESDADRTLESWLYGTNSNLPEDIVVHWVKPVDAAFHARFSAVARRYRYIVLNRAIRPAIMAKRVAWFRRPLNHELMHEAAQLLLGEQDFTSLRASGCQAKHAVRDIQDIAVSREGDFIFLDVKANAFLYHMVRNIAGTLFVVGEEKRPVKWLPELIASQDRRNAGATAPPGGLYFVHADYPAQFGLPEAYELPRLGL
ncbi:MAG: tRNA pseudouridine(38-40) synthase TruA [Proteobacteria bacterium]|nr:MAG: tRNA pseudouridine(38-40) synthase TruA [Pseudomonadota bacterium]